MDKELQLKLEETLQEHGVIHFEAFMAGNDAGIDIIIADMKNEACGLIYEELTDWFFEDFAQFLLAHNGFWSFKGEIFKEDDQICFSITFIGSYYDFEDDNENIEFSLDEHFIEKELNINISEYGIEDFYEDNIFFNFYKIKNTPIEHIDLIYFQNDKKISIVLDNKQIEVLSEKIEPKIQNITPEYPLDFDCKVIWYFESDSNRYLSVYDYKSTPIKIRLSEIIPN